MQKRGYLHLSGPEGSDLEQDVVVCGHCQFTADVKQGQFSYCGGCDSLICPKCTVEKNAGGCKSFKQRVDEQLEAERRMEQVLGGW